MQSRGTKYFRQYLIKIKPNTRFNRKFHKHLWHHINYNHIETRPADAYTQTVSPPSLSVGPQTCHAGSCTQTATSQPSGPQTSVWRGAHGPLTNRTNRAVTRCLLAQSGLHYPAHTPATQEKSTTFKPILLTDNLTSCVSKEQTAQTTLLA